jgi:hypothetical protein
MIRTQIQLTEEQYRRLRQWSRQIGVSLSEAVRRCIGSAMKHALKSPSYEDRVRAARGVCGKYRDAAERSRVALEHDRYLEEAYRS